MLFDTDVLIFVQRGNHRAAVLVNETEKRLISVQTYMELLQNTRNKQQHLNTISFLKKFNFEILPFTPSIGQRAAFYVEKYALSHSMRAGDAIIAATAIENNLMLSTANLKHFRFIDELNIQSFIPVTNH